MGILEETTALRDTLRRQMVSLVDLADKRVGWAFTRCVQDVR